MFWTVLFTSSNKHFDRQMLVLCTFVCHFCTCPLSCSPARRVLDLCTFSDFVAVQFSCSMHASPQRLAYLHIALTRKTGGDHECIPQPAKLMPCIMLEMLTPRRPDHPSMPDWLCIAAYMHARPCCWLVNTLTLVGWSMFWSMYSHASNILSHIGWTIFWHFLMQSALLAGCDSWLLKSIHQ